MQFLPPDFSRKAKENFIIKKNFSEQELAVRLEKEGFIRNSESFLQALKIKDLQGKIRSGGYYISKNMAVFEIAEILALYPSQIWVTFPEGLRKEEYAEILAKELEWEESEIRLFLEKSKEGYLFPETYLLDASWTVEDILKKLSVQFEKEFKILSKGYDNFLSQEEAVILASLVQRESRNSKEMFLISGIISNRLAQGMKLDIDATLQYQAGENGNWWPKPSSKNKEINSPYNTYLNPGLPLGPICSPGRDALSASLFPEKTPYFYYLHDFEGNIRCSKTYEDHLKNIEKYLK